MISRAESAAALVIHWLPAPVGQAEAALEGELESRLRSAPIVREPAELEGEPESRLRSAPIVREPAALEREPESH
jgi:hypothetical protein